MADVLELMIARDEGTLTEEQEVELAQVLWETEVEGGKRWYEVGPGWMGRFIWDMFNSGRWNPIPRQEDEGA